MKQYWKDKWIKALRSGDYDQGKFMLRKLYGKYCVLGVLCDIVAKEYPDKFQWKFIESDSLYLFYTFGCSYTETTTIPSSVLDIVDDLPLDCNHYMKWNDFDNLSFYEIAKKIEEVHV